MYSTCPKTKENMTTHNPQPGNETYKGDAP